MHVQSSLLSCYVTVSSGSIPTERSHTNHWWPSLLMCKSQSPPSWFYCSQILRDSFVWGSFKKSRQNSSHYEITLVTSSVPVWNPAHFFCSKILFIVQYYLCNDSSTSCFIGLVPAFEIWGFFSLFLYLGVLAGLSDKISTLRTLLWSQGK